MKKLTYLYVLFVAVLILFNFSCSKDKGSTEEQDLMQGEISENPLTMISIDTLRIPIVHYISRNSTGINAVTSEQRIAKIMGDINHNFRSIKIQFFTRKIKFLDNTQWNKEFVKQDDFIDNKVLNSFEDDTALNIFYFTKILNRIEGVIDGELGATALFPDQGNNLKLSESSIELENTATVTHEIGHYLGLYHTEETFTDSQGNIELVDGSNCAEAGDKICDTPASPDLNDGNIDEPTCNYIGNETDPAGIPYNPDTLNFMTQWAGADPEGVLCRRRFSQGQADKMISVLENERAYLITK